MTMNIIQMFTTTMATELGETLKLFTICGL